MKKVHMICHTHWDREWYKSFDEFRVRLVLVMDHLIEVLENDPEYKCFHLDGQTVVLEDYLSVRPENRDRLQRLIADRRLFVGPWYTQPDEFLVSGESLVRNLLIGTNIAESFGHVMNCGYLPDSFGQAAQIPQIMKGMELNRVIVWRGISKEDIKKSFFEWEGLDGTKITALHLPLGYGYNRYLPFEADKAYKHVLEKVDEIKDRFDDDILLLSGSDHAALHPNMVSLVQNINKEFMQQGLDYEIEISCFEDFFDSLNKEYELESLQGELKNPKDMRVHAGDSSSRMDIKYANRTEEIRLQNYVEPIKTFEFMLGREYNNRYIFGAKYPNGVINEAWKNLLKNHCHDSICTCCTDEIHNEIMSRFTCSKDIAKSLLRFNTKFFEMNLNAEELEGKAVIVWNTLTSKRNDYAEIKIYSEDGIFKILDKKGNEVFYEKIAERDFDLATISIDASMTGHRVWVKESTILLNNNFLVSGGYSTLQLVQGQKPQKTYQGTLMLLQNGMENKYLRVSFNKSGTLNIYHKETKTEYTNLNTFEDGGDAGDEYNYAPPVKDEVITSEASDIIVNIELLTNNSLEISYKIISLINVPEDFNHKKESRTGNKTLIKLQSVITLRENSKIVTVKTTINNTGKNHRIRALFESPVTSIYSYAEDYFGVIKRQNFLEKSIGWKEAGFNEKPMPLYTQQNFVDLNDGKLGLAILNKGLPEYEILNNKIIALTLMRSVGHLGKPNLTIRPGRVSGIEAEAPGSQMLGEYTFEYAIYPHGGNYDESEVPKIAHEYITPVAATQLMRQSNGSLPLEKSYMELKAEGIIFSTIKKAEKDNSIIVRLYNCSQKLREGGTFTLNYQKLKKVYISNLKESKLLECKIIDGNKVILPRLHPSQILTLSCEI